MKKFDSDYKFFDDILLKPSGYPDYLHYKKDDKKVVRSWGKWSGKSKKTGEVVKVFFAMSDWFNADGKIELERIDGDFSKLIAEKVIQKN